MAHGAPERPALTARIARVGWILTFALVAFGSTIPGLLTLLIAGLVGLFEKRRAEQTLARAPLVKWGRSTLQLLMVIMLVSAAFSPRPGMAAALSLGFILVFWAFVFGGERIGRQQELLMEKLFPILTVSGMLASVYIVVNAILTHNNRADNLFTGENSAGTLIVLLTGPVLGYLMSRTDRWRRVAVPFTLLAGAALLATGSRGAWLGFGAMLGLLVLMNRRLRTPLLIIFLVFAVAFAASPYLRNRLASAFSLEANPERVFIWQSSVRIIRDYPVTGVGAGVYQKLFDSYAMPGSQERGVAYAHNLFLQVAAEFGLVGLTVFLGLLGLVLHAGTRLAMLGSPFYQGILASLIGVLVHQQVDIPIWAVNVGGAFWAMVGITLGLFQYEWNRGSFANRAR